MTKQIPQGYKQTKVGVIPESWKVVKLGDIATIQRGASPRPIADSKWFSETSKIGWVRISDVSRAKKFLNFTEQYVSDDGVKNSRYIEIGNIIMSICATIGKPIYTNIPVCIHDGFIVFTNLTSNKFFMYYYLQLNENKWYRYGQPGSQINLNTEIVNNETIALPPLKEQEKIADILTTWDNAITKQEQLIEQKRVFKKGIMQQIFSQKIRFKDDNDNDYPFWQKYKLTKVAKTSIGLVTTMTTNYVKNDGTPLIRNSDISPNKIKDNLIQLSTQFANQYSNRKLRYLDIVTIHTGEVGISAVIDKKLDGCHGFATLNTKVDQNIVNPFFLSCYFNSCFYISYAIKMSTGDGRCNFNLKDFDNSIIPTPILEEQNKIVNFLTNIDDEITKQIDVLDQLKLQKQSLMQKLLIGQVRVKI